MVYMDCVSYRNGFRGATCLALTEINCKGCKFYKSKEKQEKQLIAVEKRLKSLNYILNEGGKYEKVKEEETRSYSGTSS